MLVLATNRPEDLDSAVLDRIDVSIHIGLPQAEQRVKLVKMYLQLHLIDPMKNDKKTKNKVDEKCAAESQIMKIATKTAGFSGREISKLMIACQYAMMLDDQQTLSVTLMDKVLETKLLEHKQKVNFASSDNSGGTQS
jgi:ATPase family AAA domain-containing protein 3A/B